MSKISVREEKAANKEAEAVLASLSRAGEAAVAQTLDDIREILKKDAPLMYHINALLHNPEWTGVLKASINGIAAVAASGDKPGKGWRLRAGNRKFGHIDRRVMQLFCYSRGFALLPPAPPRSRMLPGMHCTCPGDSGAHLHVLYVSWRRWRADLYVF